MRAQPPRFSSLQPLGGGCPDFWLVGNSRSPFLGRSLALRPKPRRRRGRRSPSLTRCENNGRFFCLVTRNFVIARSSPSRSVDHRRGPDENDDIKVTAYRLRIFRRAFFFPRSSLAIPNYVLGACFHFLPKILPRNAT